ncbi:cytochrome P450 2K1-like isoform X1 [Takifugu flavidus]|uniref:cytochrome P450 2K1-like isoform X1 n=1 Tax=Takifugu flavidus TaxID=433684 RepID=UPI00254458E2|nr:cytochrome P450 2K1-like isoform X1 [Takifugu flavidus]
MIEDLFESSTSGFLMVAIVSLLLLQLCLSFISREKRKDLPGPEALPLLGNLHQLDLKRLDCHLVQLSQKYGPIFRVYLASKKVVVLAGYTAVKQALVNQAEDFGEREIFPIFHDFNKGNGILFTNGDQWKEMRRFALMTLKDFGMGKRTIEEKIIEECQYLIEAFEQHQGEAFSNAQVISYATSNIISAIMYGRRFDYKDPTFQAMIERDHEVIHLTGSPSIQIYNVFPWLGPFLKTWRYIMKKVEINIESTRRIIGEMKETLNPGTCRCFVDAFLIHKENQESLVFQESDVNAHYYHEDNLLHCAMNLFGAGTDTTATTLQWGLLYITKYPHIQDGVQEELRRVVGNRQVRVEDRKNLPYMEAVIHETQRMANIVPMSLPHRTSRDTSFQGYFIQKGTMVIPLLTSVLYDESQWEKPHTFNPAHFLDNKGRFVRRDAFMPFSAGRRMCLGEGLARMELFLFFASLLQHFRFKPAPGVSEDSLDLTPVVGITLNPLTHKLRAISRF